MSAAVEEQASLHVDIIVDELYCLAHGKPTALSTPELCYRLVKFFNEATVHTVTGQRGFFQVYVDDLQKLVEAKP